MHVITEENAEKIRNNPAVLDYDGIRITYTRDFREEVMQRYYDGESPVKIFREHGLGPETIGEKRIERCIARWRGGIPEERDEKQPSRRKLEKMITSKDSAVAQLIAAKDQEYKDKIEKVKRQVSKQIREKDALIQKQAEENAALQQQIEEMQNVFSQLGALGLGKRRR